MALEKTRGRRISIGETAVVIGAGRSGLAAARLLCREGARVRLLDSNPGAFSGREELAGELKQLGIVIDLGPHRQDQFENAAFVVPSPGMPVARLAGLVDEERTEILAEMELAWRYLDNEPVLAVTGTSGKTTTASLAAAMLHEQGYAVFLGGNIGTPLSEYVLSGHKADVLVLEISSFQLQTCSTFCPRAGILLNITPNHLDYHKDMAEYTEAKFRLFRCQDEGDLAVLGEGLRSLAARYGLKARQVYVSATDRFPESSLMGVHNRVNEEAAWQACRLFGVSEENAARAVARFAPLPHRLERVRELGSILFVNDSKCTTVSSLKVALEAFDRPVRLLCGGKFKGGDLAGLADLVRERVAEVALFGAGREHFEQAWQGIVPMTWHETLEPAVKHLVASARKGDVVLMAPATSSFDLYANYEERGKDFKRIVGKLA
ncbi:MAG: UDP-N-acetylmuramoylalanine--D-glutamate ligase [Desulfovibrio sp.]